MTQGRTVVDSNIRSLEQGIELLSGIDSRRYTARCDEHGRNGVGCQIRHCVDFYRRFLAGLAEGRIDYNLRERDRLLEERRDEGIRALKQLIAGLREIEQAQLGTAVDVRLEPLDPLDPEGPAGAEGWCRSSVLRELQFLLSHTNHHYALIALLLERQGLPADSRPTGFGVAPTTLAHWNQSGA